jgi:hypothetical protein
MKNWLQQAIEENEKFNKSDFGKLSDAKINHLATVKQNGINAKKSGQFYEFAKEGGKKQGKITGKHNAKSGHLANIRKLASTKEVRERAKANTDYKAIAENQKKPIYQFTMDGKFIAEYPSIKEAALIIGCHPCNITAVANGYQKSCKKSIWKHKK